VIVGSQKVLDQMRNDVMRIARLYGADMNQPAKREMIELLWLWNKLGDAPTFTESTDEYDVDSIEVPFLHFSVGTHREDVWRWFEAQNPDFLVTDAMYRKHRLAFSAGEAQTGGDGAASGQMRMAGSFFRGRRCFIRTRSANSCVDCQNHPPMTWCG